MRLHNRCPNDVFYFVGDISEINKRTEEIRQQLPPNESDEALQIFPGIAMSVGFERVASGGQWVKFEKNDLVITIMIQMGENGPIRRLRDAYPMEYGDIIVTADPEWSVGRDPESNTWVLRLCNDEALETMGRQFDHIEYRTETVADHPRVPFAEPAGLRILESCHGTRLRAYDNDWKVNMTPYPAQGWEHWNIEEMHGKVIFKTIYKPGNKQTGRLLSVLPDGSSVDLISRSEEFNTWKPIKNEDQSWSFLSAHGKWLSAHTNGSVATVENCSNWEHFWLYNPEHVKTLKTDVVMSESESSVVADEPNGRLNLKSFHGTYLRANELDCKVDMTSGPEQTWKNWYVEDRKGKVVFKSIHSPGRFLRAYPDGNVDLVMHHPKDWEKWVPYKNDDGSWSFRSFHGKWLSAHANGFVDSVEDLSSSEHFWLTRW